MVRLPTLFGLLALAAPALAQAAPTPAPAPGAAPPPAGPAAQPQRTTATFGDWVLRCIRPEHGAANCEVDQVLLDKGQFVSQTAIGRPAKAEPMRMTILLPPNVSLTAAPRLLGAANETGTPPLELGWRRCIPSGCIADAVLTDAQVARVRARTENARLVFQDSTGREVTLPFAPRGLPQALDALAKEDQRPTAP